MIVGKRIKTAFTLNTRGQLTPIGENIFQFKRRRTRSKRNNSSLKGAKSNERRNSGGIR
ncbi:MAG: hypothetical protein KC478_04285 [Bacteriovoracaceae bacterium]|nr:hypothetical protein [Bacteriovoracaceae bacterium]